MNLCYAYSRGKCTAGGKCTRKHRAFEPSEMLKRDRWEVQRENAGYPIPYERSPEQAAKARENVTKNGGSGTPRGDDKGTKGGGKGAKGAKGSKPCGYITNGKPCPHGDKCYSFANTPNHPKAPNAAPK